MGQAGRVVRSGVKVAKITLGISVEENIFPGFRHRIVEGDYRLRRIGLCPRREIGYRIDTGRAVIGIVGHSRYQGELEAAAEVFLERRHRVQFVGRRAAEINPGRPVQALREVSLDGGQRESSQRVREIRGVRVGEIYRIDAVLVLRRGGRAENSRIDDRAVSRPAKFYVPGAVVYSGRDVPIGGRFRIKVHVRQQNSGRARGKRQDVGAIEQDQVGAILDQHRRRAGGAEVGQKIRGREGQPRNRHRSAKRTGGSVAGSYFRRRTAHAVVDVEQAEILHHHRVFQRARACGTRLDVGCEEHFLLMGAQGRNVSRADVEISSTADGRSSTCGRCP